MIFLPLSIDLKEIVEFRLVISTTTGAINLFDSSNRSKRDFVRRNTDHWAISLVQLMDIHSTVSVEFLPFQYERGEV